MAPCLWLLYGLELTIKFLGGGFLQKFLYTGDIAKEGWDYAKLTPYFWGLVAAGMFGLIVFFLLKYLYIIFSKKEEANVHLQKFFKSTAMSVALLFFLPFAVILGMILIN